MGGGGRPFARRAAAALLAAAAWLAAAAPAPAATWKGREMEWRWRDAPWTLGPFRLAPRFSLVDAGYDSNVYYYSLESPVRDYTFTATPLLNVYVPLRKKVILALSEAPSYVYFVETRQERTWNNALRGDLIFNYNRVLIMAGGGWTTARERWNTEIDIRPRMQSWFGEATALAQLTGRVSFGVSGRARRYDFENRMFEMFNIRDRLNRREAVGEAALYYMPSRTLRLVVAGELGDYRFDNPAVAMDSTGTRVSGGFELLTPGRLRGALRAGWRTLVTRDPARPDFRGLAGEGSFTYDAARRVVLRASARREPSFSLWHDNSFFVETRGRAGVSVFPVPRLRLDYDFDRGRNDYSLETPAAALPGPAPAAVKRRDDYVIHTVGVAVRVAPKTWVGASWNSWTRRSNLEWENDHRDFVGLNLTHEF